MSTPPEPGLLRALSACGALCAVPHPTFFIRLDVPLPSSQISQTWILKAASVSRPITTYTPWSVLSKPEQWWVTQCEKCRKHKAFHAELNLRSRGALQSNRKSIVAIQSGIRYCVLCLWGWTIWVCLYHITTHMRGMHLSMVVQCHWVTGMFSHYSDVLRPWLCDTVSNCILFYFSCLLWHLHTCNTRRWQRSP